MSESGLLPASDHSGFIAWGGRIEMPSVANFTGSSDFSSAVKAR